MSDRPIVLFVCIHNAGRSMAARLLLDHYAMGNIDVRSAGSEPSNEVNQMVVEVLHERGIDARGEQPKLLTYEMAREADVAITMGCGDACPHFPGKRYEDWDLVDPSGQTIEVVRSIVDGIDRRTQLLCDQLLGGDEPE